VYSAALPLRFDLGEKGFKRRRLWQRVIRQPQHRPKNVADAVAIVIAEITALDALKQRPRLLPAQGEAEKVFEKVEPLKHRDGHRLRANVSVELRSLN
jgi:hypothetical protein